MDIKLLLLKSISALYYFSRTGATSAEIVKNTIETVVDQMEISYDPTDISKERKALSDLKLLIERLLNKDLTQVIDHEDILLRIEIACDEDVRTIDLFKRQLIADVDTDEATAKFRSDLSELQDYLSEEKLVATIRAASRAISFDRGSIKDLNTFKLQLIDKLNTVKVDNKTTSDDPNVIDISDIAKLEETFKKAEELISEEGILKFPFKGMNRMFGENGGGRRGEYIAVHALSGHNKTGTLLDIFCSMCLFNKPMPLDPTKKPLHVYFTIEDPITEIVRKIYTMIRQHETGLPVELRGIPYKEQAGYVSERLSSQGFHVKIIDFENGGSPFKYLNYLETFQEEGYEIISVGCDYVNLMDREAVGKNNIADNTKGLHRIISDWTKPRDIFHYTAGQLSSDARDVLRMFPEDFIKRLVDKGYYENCRTLSTEFDMEFFVAKKVHNGETWQEFEWGKHRKLGATLETDKYFAMKYFPVGMIGYPWDVDSETEDFSYKKVGNRSTQGEGIAEWSDF